MNADAAPAARPTEIHAISGELCPWQMSYPPGVQWQAQFTAITLPAMLERSVAAYPARPAMHFLGKVTSYGELGAMVDRAAAGLQALGIAKGDSVGLMMPNTPTFIVFYFAALKAGATVVNFNPLYTVDELAHQAADAELTLMVTLDLAATFPKVEALVARGAVPRAVVADFAALLPAMKHALFSLLKRSERVEWRQSRVADRLIDEQTVLAPGQAFTPVPIDPDADIAVLQYTGGTTGTPKGAMLTHGNLTINVAQVMAWCPWLEQGQERMMGILPFFHVFAMTAVMNFAIAKGAEILIMPRFELAAALKLIHASRPTIMAGVPTLFNAIARSRDAKKYDLSGFKFCISGGAPLPASVKQAFEAASGCKLVEGYGLSETAPVATCNPAGTALDNTREMSIGLPLPATHLSLRDLDDPSIEVPMGEKGEICIAGPQVMRGYWKQPAETAHAFVGRYFRTGDVATMAPDGFVYIVDRIKDIIIVAGFNVYPRRIEDALHSHPAVEEATVIGVPDALRGEAPRAFVKLREGMAATPSQLMAHIRPLLANIEIPDAVEIRNELPKTMIGKLSKKELRAEFAVKPVLHGNTV